MCKQIDKQWECGHTGFYNIEWCHKEGCRGPGAIHDILKMQGKCYDCMTRDKNPNPKPKK